MVDRFNSIYVVPDSYILIRAVLVVIPVNRGNGNGRHTEFQHKGRNWDTSTRRTLFYRSFPKGIGKRTIQPDPYLRIKISSESQVGSNAGKL